MRAMENETLKNGMTVIDMMRQALEDAAIICRANTGSPLKGWAAYRLDCDDEKTAEWIREMQQQWTNACNSCAGRIDQLADQLYEINQRDLGYEPVGDGTWRKKDAAKEP